MNQDDVGALKQLLSDFENEKSLIGFDLHDGVVQLLVGSKLQLDSIDLTSDVENKKTGAKIAGVKQILDDAITQLRKLISDLAATSIENAQLETELDSLVNRFRHECDDAPQILTEWKGLSTDLDSLLAGTVLGIVKEGLNNVVKHSKATLAWVQVSVKNAVVEILVFDNGRGIENSDDPIGSGAQRLGLKGIANRARIFGGTCKVISQWRDPSEFEQLIAELDKRESGPPMATKTGTAVQVAIPV